jgi:hypothetical protein
LVKLQVFQAATPESQEWVILLDESVRETLMNLDGRPQRYTWRPPSVRVLKSSERKRLRYSDMPHYSSSVLVLREPALAALADLLSADGELLPLDCPDAPMWLFNCCRVIDALDEGHSRVVRFPSSGRIMRVESYDFQVGRLIGVNAFKIPQLARTTLFVTSPVVQAAEHAQLTRSEFTPIWEGESAES